MADKKLNEVPVVSDIVTIFGKRSNGEIVQIDKSNLATLLGELLQNAYDSYSLKESIETEIGVGLGVYYITQPNLASLSCIVIINYDNYQVLWMKGNLSFSVSLLKLTVVSKVGDIDINVRKILKQ